MGLFSAIVKGQTQLSTVDDDDHHVSDRLPRVYGRTAFFFLPKLVNNIQHFHSLEMERREIVFARRGRRGTNNEQHLMQHLFCLVLANADDLFKVCHPDNCLFG